MPGNHDLYTRSSLVYHRKLFAPRVLVRFAGNRRADLLSARSAGWATTPRPSRFKHVAAQFQLLEFQRSVCRRWNSTLKACSTAGDRRPPARVPDDPLSLRRIRLFPRLRNSRALLHLLRGGENLCCCTPQTTALHLIPARLVLTLYPGAACRKPAPKSFWLFEPFGESSTPAAACGKTRGRAGRIAAGRPRGLTAPAGGGRNRVPSGSSSAPRWCHRPGGKAISRLVQCRHSSTWW